MADVLLYETNDGGEVVVEVGELALDYGLETAVYLSLFGGNEDDGGDRASESKQWWGNLAEPDSRRHLRSETQHLLRTLPPTEANLLRVQDAMGRDLAWMQESLGAEVTAVATLTGPNSVRLTITIVVDGSTTPVVLEPHWPLQQAA